MRGLGVATGGNSRRVPVKAMGTVTVALCCAWLAAQPAQADAASCSRHPAATDIFQVRAETAAHLYIHRVGNEIRVNEGGPDLDCDEFGEPTVTAVNEIQVIGNGFSTTVTIVDPADLEPGLTDEPGSDDEIEVFVDLGTGPDWLELASGWSSAAQQLRALQIGAGTSGVNVNASETTDDVDVTLEDERLFLHGGEDSTIHANGAAGTGAPFAAPVELEGGRGSSLIGGASNDRFAITRGLALADGGGGAFDELYAETSFTPYRIVVDLATPSAEFGGIETQIANIESVIGGDAADVLRGTAGRNGIRGGFGNDLLEGRGDGDLLEGGPGRDRVSFRSSPIGVTANLAVTGDQDTGQGIDVIKQVEGLLGSPHADTLLGNDRANTLGGAAGEDNLRGKAGDDVLKGGSERDECNGGPGRDTLRSCEG